MCKTTFYRLRRKCPNLFAYVAQYETVDQMRREAKQRLHEKFEETKPFHERLTMFEKMQENLDAEFQQNFGYNLADVKEYLDGCKNVRA